MIAGATMAISAAVEFCLKDAADNNRLTSLTYQRLMLGCSIKSAGYLAAFLQAGRAWGSDFWESSEGGLRVGQRPWSWPAEWASPDSPDCLSLSLLPSQAAPIWNPALALSYPTLAAASLVANATILRQASHAA